MRCMIGLRNAVEMPLIREGARPTLVLQGNG